MIGTVVLVAAALVAAPGTRTTSAEAAALSPITVTGTRLPAPEFDVPAAIGVVTQDEIVHGAPAMALAQSLARVPGVVAQNRQSYAQGLQLSIRGFGARASFGVRGIRLLVDGIPASTPAGQGETDTFDLAIARRIEVLRGPFSALYGNAAGGVIQIFTQDGPPRPTAKASTLFGSYGTRIQRIEAGGTAGRFNYITDVGHFYTRGYREHSAAERDNLRAKLRYVLGGDSSLTLLLNGENQPFAQDPSGLTKAQFQDNPRQAVARVVKFGAGESHRDRQAGLVYDQRLGPNDRLHAMGYFGSRRVIQFLPFRGAAPAGGGAVIDLDNNSGGGGLRWHHDFSSAGVPLSLVAGLQYQRLHARRKGFVNDDGVAGALRRNEDDFSTGDGVYFQAQWQPGDWRIMAGLRRSRVKFESNDHYITPENSDDSGARSFSSIDPVFGALYKINRHLNVYADYGRGFETPTLAELAYRPDGEAGFNDRLQPSASHNYEAGLKMHWGAAKLKIALFRITSDNEIVVASSKNGRTGYRNAGSTRRHGMEWSFEDQFAGGLGLYLSWSYLHARFHGGALDDKRLPGVPRQTFYGELRWHYQPLGFFASLSAQWRDRVYVNDENTDFTESYAVVNGRFGFRQYLGRWELKEFARVDNVFDRHYVGAVIVNAGNNRYFEPAPDRNVLIGISASCAF